MTPSSSSYRLSQRRQSDRNGASENWNAYNTDRTWNVIDAITDIAKQTGKSPAQIALRWLLQRPGVTAPIIGARSIEQLTDNLGATGWSLTEKQLSVLTDASPLPTVYPYQLLSQFRRKSA